ncbi:hypothetical protein LZ32DRAFT_602461 [Colletotrichum eremochloae]|nr:hypothetical protein LZ32DRAFT_602461 [Colletotrichum eremochloae]
MASTTVLNGSATRGSEMEAEVPRAARPGTTSIVTDTAANIPITCVGKAEDTGKAPGSRARERA